MHLCYKYTRIIRLLNVPRGFWTWNTVVRLKRTMLVIIILYYTNEKQFVICLIRAAAADTLFCERVRVIVLHGVGMTCLGKHNTRTTERVNCIFPLHRPPTISLFLVYWLMDDVYNVKMFFFILRRYIAATHFF